MAAPRIDPAREAAASEMVAEALVEQAGREGFARVIVCQGQPWCPLEFEAAVHAQFERCYWCTVISVYGDGRVVRQDPQVA